MTNDQPLTLDTPRQLTLDTPAEPAQPDTPELGEPITLPAPAGWPQPPAAEAFHGICGEIVHTLSPKPRPTRSRSSPSCWSPPAR